jgi:hypothetical protein
MTRSTSRTASCTKDDARSRLRRAESFLVGADLVLGERVDTPDEDDAINLSGVAAALAVLAGIAAVDAACCQRLGIRSRGQDHAQAVALVKQVVPGGDDLAKDLDRLLGLKDNAHYGILGVPESDARKAVTWARRLVERTQVVLRS